MEDIFLVYILLGAILVLPSKDELHLWQVAAVICTWPIVIIYTLVQVIKGES